MRLDAAFVELQRLERCLLGLDAAVPAQLKRRDFRSDLRRHRVGTRRPLQRGERAIVIAEVFEPPGVQEFEVGVRSLSGGRRSHRSNSRTANAPGTRQRPRDGHAMMRRHVMTVKDLAQDVIVRDVSTGRALEAPCP